jgi:hypothetical protein
MIAAFKAGFDAFVSNSPLRNFRPDLDTFKEWQRGWNAGYRRAYIRANKIEKSRGQ